MLDLKSSGEIRVRQLQQPTVGNAAHQAQKHSTSKPQLAKGSDDISVSAPHFSAVHMSCICTVQWKTDSSGVLGAVRHGWRALSVPTQGAARLLTFSETEQKPVTHRTN